MREYLNLKRTAIFIVCGLFLFFIFGCKNEKLVSKDEKVPINAENNAEKKSQEKLVVFEHKSFDSSADALKEILNATKPLAVGFGEFHQQTKTIKYMSAINRFTEMLIPVFASNTSDLIVETWMATGDCGENEKAVVAEVEKVTKRPEETENETIAMLKKAKSLGIQPHILEVECDDYAKIINGDSGVDYFGLLELVARRIEDKSIYLINHRNKVAQQKKIVNDKMLAIYCGAIHNDAKPEDIWKTVSFALSISKIVKKRYVEIDLLVPEFIESSNLLKEKAWYSLFKKKASKDKVLMIKLREDAYLIIFKRDVKDNKERRLN